MALALIPAQIQPDKPQSTGATWAMEVRGQSLAYADSGVHLAEGPIAEGFVIAGWLGTVIAVALVAGVSWAVAAALRASRVPVVAFGIAMLAQPYLFERGVLGLSEALGKSIQVALLATLMVMVTRATREVARRQLGVDSGAPEVSRRTLEVGPQHCTSDRHPRAECPRCIPCSEGASLIMLRTENPDGKSSVGINRLHVATRAPIDKPGGLNRLVQSLADSQRLLGFDARIIHSVNGKQFQVAGGTASLPPLNEEDWVMFHFAQTTRDGLRAVEGRGKHAFGFHGPWAFEGRAAKQPAPVVGIKYLMERMAYRKFDRFVTDSYAFADLLRRKYAVPPSRIGLIIRALT